MTPSQPRGRSRRTRTGSLGWAAVLFSLLLILVACGGDDEPEPAADATDAPAAATETSEDSTESDTEVADDAEPADDDGEPADDAVETDEADSADEEASVPDALADLASETGSATVTIGDETFEFTLAGTQTIDGTTYVGRCEGLFGMVMGSGFASDGQDIAVDLEIPPVDWETYEDDRFDPPSVEVEDNVSNASWVADQGDEFVAGSTVGEYQQEGLTASGSATFVNQWDPESEPVEGTFEIDCEA